MKDKKKKRTHFKASFYWMFALAFSVIFAVFFFQADMFPQKWKLACLVIIGVILLVTGFFSIWNSRHRKQTVIKIIDVIVALIMAALSFLLPYYETRVSNMIDNNNVSSNKVKVNVYVMSDAYKAEHPDLFKDDPHSASFADKKEELESYKDDAFITSLGVDGEYEKAAISEIEKMLNTSLTIEDKDSVQEAAYALYQNEQPVLLLSSAYASMLDDMAGYENFDEDTRIIYSVEVPEKSSNLSLSNTDLTSKPFAVFIGGNDEEGELSLTGRTDVDMVVVVNPVTYQIGIFSYPRDSYVPNPALGNGLDKLTHLGVSGLDNTMHGLENLLGIDVDNYVLINFTTYQEIINAIGGVDVYNPYTFNWSYNDNYEFQEGNIHLDGGHALEYVRERHNLPDGDFGRNMHQQIVMKAILEKITSPSMLIHFDSLITALNGTFLTNLTKDSIYSFMQYQLNNNVQWNILTYRAEGLTDYAICASAPAQELSVVLPYENQLDFMSQKAIDIFNGEILSEEEMPEGQGIRWEAVHGGSAVDDTPAYYEAPVETPQPVQPEPTYAPIVQPAEDNSQSDSGGGNVEPSGDNNNNTVPSDDNGGSTDIQPVVTPDANNGIEEN